MEKMKRLKVEFCRMWRNALLYSDIGGCEKRIYAKRDSGSKSRTETCKTSASATSSKSVTVRE